MRMQLIEFHEKNFCPASIRQSIVESLGLALQWGQITRAFAPTFLQFCHLIHPRPIWDLCSGSGKAVDFLLQELLHEHSHCPHITLTDLYPNLASFHYLQQRYPQHLHFADFPVNALEISAQLQGKAVMILNGFHHFTPQQAQQLLQTCVQNRVPFFIQESFPRNCLRLFSMLHLLIPAVFLNPFLGSQKRFPKLFYTYFLPLIPLLGLWDGIISTLRIYEQQDLQRLLASMEKESESFHCTYQEIPFRPFGKASIFYGIPKELLKKK